MAQMGFFDVENRYAALDARHGPPLGEDQCPRAMGSVPQPPGGSLAQATRPAQVQCRVQALGCRHHVQGHRCAPSAICRTIRSSTRCATASPLCVFWVCALKTRCPTPRPCGSAAPKATGPGAARSWMLRLSQFPSNAIVVTTTPRSGKVRRPGHGRTSRPAASPERHGCALDEETRQKSLRLQEPPRHRPSVQADPALSCDGCLGSTARRLTRC